MTHFIRTKERKTYNTIIECEVYKDDLSASINLEKYSEELLKLSTDKQSGFIADFTNLNEIRGLWFERYCDDYTDINKFVQEIFINISNKYDYDYITD